MSEHTVTVELSMLHAIALLLAATTNHHRAKAKDNGGWAGFYNDAGCELREAINETLEADAR